MTTRTAIETFTESISRQRREMEGLKSSRRELEQELAESFVAELRGGSRTGRSHETLERAIGKIDADIDRRIPALRQAETIREQMVAADAAAALDEIRPRRTAILAEFWIVANRLHELLIAALAQNARLDELAYADSEIRGDEVRAIAGLATVETAAPQLVNASIGDLPRLATEFEDDLAVQRRSDQ